MADRIEIQPKKPGEGNDATPPAPGEQALGKLRQQIQKKETSTQLGQIAQQVEQGGKKEAEQAVRTSSPLIQERAEVANLTAEQLEQMQANLRIEGVGGQGV